MNPRCFPLQIIPILTILKTIKRLTMTSIHLVVWIIVTYRDFMGGCFSKTHVENFEVQMLQFIIPLSVQFSHSVVSHSLRPHGLQHARPPCPSPTLRVYSSSCPLSQWCHPTISSCCPLLLLPSIFPSTRVLSNESVLCIRWPKYWSFSFSISLSNAYSGLISFRIDGFDVLAVQGTLKSLLQHHSSK